jgi:predicted phosphoribosyltransferase
MTTLKTQVPFGDREEAGRQLADRLAELELPSDTLVVGIPRGGVAVAAVVAEVLDLPLDVIVAHKLGAPGNPEFAIGAAAADGTRVIEPWAWEAGDVTDEFIAWETQRQVQRARDRERRLRQNRPPPSLAGRTVVVVDDGIATGSTVHVAVRAARAAGASRVIVASPVAAPDTLERLKGIADEAIALATPDPFVAVGLWYRRFDQVGDEEVEALLASGDPSEARREQHE